VWRRGPEGRAARAAREADPEYQAWLARKRGLDAIFAGMVDLDRARRVRAAIAMGESCAECGATLDELIFWRKVDAGQPAGMESGRAGRRSAPVCPGCRCRQPHKYRLALCDRCRPAGHSWDYDPAFGSSRVVRWRCPDAGPDHGGPFCEDCHPSAWQPGRCPGCRRAVMFRYGAERRRWVKDPDRPWRLAEVPYGEPLAAYCSTRCRDLVRRELAAQRRTAERNPVLCAGCHEVMDGPRSDARYCSPACRQRAYRARRG